MTLEEARLKPEYLCDSKIIDKLCEVGLLEKFDHILSYLGDDELISSCNDEYICDHDQCFITDGISNHVMEIVYSNTSPNKIVQYLHSIRGATFVIIVSMEKGKPISYDLRIEESAYEDAIENICKFFKRYKEVDAIDDMEYYIKSYRPYDDYILSNDSKIIIP